MKLRAVMLAALGALLGGTLLGGMAGAEPKEKVDICHKRGNGTYKLITVSKKAEPAHKRHGDASPGDTVEGETLAEDCSFEEPEPQRFSSGQLSFGPNGWGGWSCPSGMTAVDGGTTLTSVSDQGVAAPGADPVDGFSYPTYPHYTFPAGETGFVVHNDNDSETGEVFVDCVPSS